MDPNAFVTRCMTSCQFQLVAPTPQFPGQKFQQCFVRGIVHWSRPQFNLEFTTDHLADTVRTCPRLDLQQQEEVFAITSDIRRQVHLVSLASWRVYRQSYKRPVELLRVGGLYWNCQRTRQSKRWTHDNQKDKVDL
jgi:hypothetical protein